MNLLLSLKGINLFSSISVLFSLFLYLPAPWWSHARSRRELKMTVVLSTIKNPQSNTGNIFTTYSWYSNKFYFRVFFQRSDWIRVSSISLTVWDSFHEHVNEVELVGLTLSTYWLKTRTEGIQTASWFNRNILNFSYEDCYSFYHVWPGYYDWVASCFPQCL